MQQLLGGREPDATPCSGTDGIRVCAFLPVFPSPVLSLPFQHHGYIHLCLWPAYAALAVVCAYLMLWACLLFPWVLPTNIN